MWIKLSWSSGVRPICRRDWLARVCVCSINAQTCHLFADTFDLGIIFGRRLLPSMVPVSITFPTQLLIHGTHAVRHMHSRSLIVFTACGNISATSYDCVLGLGYQPGTVFTPDSLLLKQGLGLFAFLMCPQVDITTVSANHCAKAGAWWVNGYDSTTYSGNPNWTPFTSTTTHTVTCVACEQTHSHMLLVCWTLASMDHSRQLQLAPSALLLCHQE